MGGVPKYFCTGLCDDIRSSNICLTYTFTERWHKLSHYVHPGYY